MRPGLVVEPGAAPVACRPARRDSVPRVSVVVVTWNGRPLLERFLPSVLATAHADLEVVVADNASTDGTADWLRETYPRVVVVRHAENRLFAGGNNAAVGRTTGDLPCFLNNDVEVPPGWLGPLVAAFDDSGVVAVQPTLLQHADRTRFEYAGAAGGFLDRDGIPFTRGRLFDTLEADTGQYDDARDIFWATGAALVVRRAAFLAAGGFDEPFGMHMEEIDLCWRLARAGGRIRAEPASRVYHLGGASLPRGARKTYLNYRNGLAMLVKNLPDRTWAARCAAGSCWTQRRQPAWPAGSATRPRPSPARGATSARARRVAAPRARRAPRAPLLPRQHRRGLLRPRPASASRTSPEALCRPPARPAAARAPSPAPRPGRRPSARP